MNEDKSIEIFKYCKKEEHFLPDFLSKIAQGDQKILLLKIRNVFHKLVPVWKYIVPKYLEYVPFSHWLVPKFLNTVTNLVLNLFLSMKNYS